MALTARQVNQVVDLLSAGHHFCALSRDIHEIIIQAEINNGLYVIHEQDGQVLGFASGWMVNQETISQIKEFGLLGCMNKNIVLEAGPHLYASHSCAHSIAPHFLLLSIIKKLIKKSAPISICAYQTNRSAQPRWTQKRVKQCQPH